LIQIQNTTVSLIFPEKPFFLDSSFNNKVLSFSFLTVVFEFFKNSARVFQMILSFFGKTLEINRKSILRFKEREKVFAFKKRNLHF